MRINALANRPVSRVQFTDEATQAGWSGGLAADLTAGKLNDLTGDPMQRRDDRGGVQPNGLSGHAESGWADLCYHRVR